MSEDQLPKGSHVAGDCASDYWMGIDLPVSGTDQGAGVASYDIFVSTNDGP